MLRGAKIIVDTWVKIRRWDKLIIVTSIEHKDEAEAIDAYAKIKAKSSQILVVEDGGQHVGVFFDRNENIFEPYTAIIAATDYSLVTTRAAKKAIQSRKKFLSLPLSTNDGRSMLEYDFLMMDPRRSRNRAQIIMKYIKEAAEIHVTTPAGTDLYCKKVNRKPGFFNGVLKDGRGYSSASIEVYIPIEETKTNGIMVVDGSFGYIGRPEQPTKIIFKDGKIVDIENHMAGIRLKEYIDGYKDERIYIGGEFGIGLNSMSQCLGNCYIEDESTYGTFHIGLGRNIALGGMQNANGHFDLVALEPSIYVDNRCIMKDGVVTIPEFLHY
ncbi:MAG: peptidase [Holdemanella sp.]|nr:peptidase [Holdemanella sp.]